MQQCSDFLSSTLESLANFSIFTCYHPVCSVVRWSLLPAVIPFWCAAKESNCHLRSLSCTGAPLCCRVAPWLCGNPLQLCRAAELCMWGTWSVQLGRNRQRLGISTNTAVLKQNLFFYLSWGDLAEINNCTFVCLQPVPALLLHSRGHAPHLLHLHLRQVRVWVTLSCAGFRVSFPLDICKIGPFRLIMCLQMHQSEFWPVFTGKDKER